MNNSDDTPTELPGITLTASVNYAPILGDLVNSDNGQCDWPMLVDEPMPSDNFITTADMLRAKDHRLLHAISTNNICNSNVCNTSSNCSSAGFRSDGDEFSCSFTVANEADEYQMVEKINESLDEHRRVLHAQYQAPSYDIM